MSNIAGNICDAIDIIVQRSLDQASFDKTIQAKIVSVDDATIGRYKIKYQDSTLYAYSNNLDISYTPNTSVYVTVPGGDLSKDKTIVGATKRLGINYISTIEEDKKYADVGVNAVTESASYGVSSWRPRDSAVKILYSKGSTNNLLTIDEKSLGIYLESAGYLTLGANIQTKLAPEQQLRGNYGIIFAFDFEDDSTGETVTKLFTIDVDRMVGNPYKFLNKTRQYGVFEVPGARFKEINYISLFAIDFPNTKTSNFPEDIIFSDIQIQAANALSNEDLSSYSVILTTPKGGFFDVDALDKDIKTIQAEVRLKGKVANENTQGLEFYWFSEDASMTSKDVMYSPYGGQGWRCLNNYNVVTQDPKSITYIPGKSVLEIKKSDIIAKQVRYKCAVVYDGSVFSKDIVIKNLTSKYEVSIESSKGTQFYFDRGSTDLVCKINGINDLSKCSFSWSFTDSTNRFESLDETIELNSTLNEKMLQLDKILSDVSEEKITLVSSQDKIDSLKSEIEHLGKQQRVDKNNIYSVAINTIQKFATYKCTVHYDGAYIGTAAITLSNSFELKDGYNLIINNGTQVFKYNEDGVSPTNTSFEKPLKLNALTFSAFDNLGEEIDFEVLKRCPIKWTVPTEDTLIKIPNSYKPESVDTINNTATYANITSFTYGIEDRYFNSKKRNEIQLSIEYQGRILLAQTAFTFTKEGESGTNGTDFIAKIIPNTKSGVQPPSQVVLTQYSVNDRQLNFTPNSTKKWFRVQLWHNGINIFEKTDGSGNSSDGKPATITWSILRNKYSATISDPSDLTVNQSGEFSSTDLSLTASASPCNIVQAAIKYDGITYYATLPIVTIQVLNAAYSIERKEHSGFDYAMYSGDGQKPQYDNTTPFELKILRQIQGATEDVSEKTEAYAVNYNWSVKGSVYDGATKKWVNQANLIENNLFMDDLKRNQKKYKPIDEYNGLCLSNALQCYIKQGKSGGSNVLRIHIPIHLYLNRYGHAAINGWNGNSIDIDEKGGVILAPQVGAGKKESDNTFTGSIMGVVKESGHSQEETGLFGYKKGQRTYFLDAESGKATFGTNSSGQIIIDPTSGKGQIYSKDYAEDKTGMMIDLVSPEIKWGNGNFAVNKNGHITAKGGGSIAGWTINNNDIFKGKAGLSSDNSKDANIAFWAGNTNRAAAPFRVDYSGHIWANRGVIGNGSSKITIGNSANSTANSALYSGSKTSFNANSSGFYLGTDGVAIGSTRDGVSNFQVNSSGQLVARSGYIGNGSRGWTIGDTSLYNQKNNFSAAVNGVYIGTNGISLGAYDSSTGSSPFQVNSSGNLIAKKGTIAGWNLTTNRLESADRKTYLGTSGLKVGDNFSVNNNGNLTASGINVSGRIVGTSGSIGGWTINGTQLKGGNVYLNNDGSIGGSKWSITAGGKATFNDVYINGTGSLSGQFNGASTGSFQGGGSSFGVGGGGTNLSGGTAVGGTPLPKYITDLVVSKLTVEDTFIFRTNEVEWTYAMQGITSIDYTDRNLTIRYSNCKVLGKRNTGGGGSSSAPKS